MLKRYKGKFIKIYIMSKLDYLTEDTLLPQDQKFVCLSFLTDNYRNIFLKMDIEGGEINILRTLSQKNLAKISVISIEILPGTATLNFISSLDLFMPFDYEFYRERRYGLIHIERKNPHWTDNLNLFQNLILINSKPNLPF